MTLRVRLVLTITMVLVFTMGTTFTIIYLIVYRSADRQLNDELFAQAKQEALELMVAGGDAKHLSENDTIELEDGTRLTRYAIVYRPDGTIAGATSNFTCPLPALADVKHPRGETFDLNCGALHLRSSFVRVSPTSDDMLLLAVPRTEFDADTNNLLRTMATALMVSLALGTIIALTLSRGLTKDHEAIALVARQVADGDLSARVDSKARDREVRQLGADIDHMIDRLQTLMAAQEQFIAHAAHELRSPLTSAYGEIDLALRRERTAEEYREAMEYSHESLKRLTVLVTQLLQLARAGSDAHANIAQLSLTEVVEGVAGRLSKAYAEKGVELVRELEPCPGEGRKMELERLLRNLLENALRHTPSGKKVTVRTRDLGEVYELSVTDEGTGVTAVEAEHLFEPFFRGSQERATDAIGSGLGLPIVRQIAESHGGGVRLDRSYGPPGARFVVELRLRPKAALSKGDAT